MSSTVYPSNSFVTMGMLELFRKQLEEQFRNEFNARLKTVEEKCNVVLTKVPVLECRTEQVATLRRELEEEREGRSGNDEAFLESVNKLMEEIVQLSLKIVVLEERIVEVEERNNKDAPISESSSEPQEQEPQQRSSSLTVSNQTLLDNTGAGIDIPMNTEIESSQSPPPTSDPPPDRTHTQAISEPLETTDDGSSEEPSRTRTEVCHRKASVTGRFLPFSCQCGLEFDEEFSLTKHVMEETVEQTIRRRAEFIQKASSSTSKNVKSSSTSATHLNKDKNPHPPLRTDKAKKVSADRRLKKTAQFQKKTSTELHSHGQHGDIRHGFGKQVVNENGRTKYHCECGERSYFRKSELTRHIRNILEKSPVT